MLDAHAPFFKALEGKKQIIWDWNGTLLNDVELAVSVVNTLLTERNLPGLHHQKYKETFDFPVKKFYDDLGFTYESESFADLCHRFVEKFMAGFRHTPLQLGMFEVIKECHEQGLKQSVLSASDQVSLDEMIGHFQLRPYFDFVYGIGDKFAASKVARGEELMTIGKFNPAETVLIGDTLHDLEVADALGIDALLLAHGHQTAERLRAKHGKVLDLQKMESRST